MKVKWLDRSLLISPVYYALCTNKELLKKELRRLKVQKDLDISCGFGATTNFMKSQTGENIAIVCLFDHTKELEQIYALLAHEAVHIWQEIKENIGETNPSFEFEAYSIQKITQELLYEYKRQRNKKRK